MDFGVWIHFERITREQVSSLGFVFILLRMSETMVSGLGIATIEKGFETPVELHLQTQDPTPMFFIAH
jgi:hypothetical protein